MNKKILFIAVLALMTVVSFGTVSAADDNGTGDTATSDAGDISLADSEEGGNASGPIISEINVNNSMSNEEIQAKFDAELKDNTVINFAPGKYKDVKLKVTKEVIIKKKFLGIKYNKTERHTLNNITINGNGATLTGKPEMSNYKNGIFEVTDVNRVRLSGFNLICQGDKKNNMEAPSCLVISNTTKAIVENNNISGGSYSLYLGNKFIKGKYIRPNYDIIVRNNTITNTRDTSIYSIGSARCRIYNNTVINPIKQGIVEIHCYGPNSIVENNTLIGAKEGIHLIYSTGYKVTKNILNNCDIGINCNETHNVFCDENKFLNNTNIAFLLTDKCTNIQIGENNDFSGLPSLTNKIVQCIPMPDYNSFGIMQVI